MISRSDAPAVAADVPARWRRSWKRVRRRGQRLERSLPVGREVAVEQWAAFTDVKIERVGAFLDELVEVVRRGSGLRSPGSSLCGAQRRTSVGRVSGPRLG